MAAAPAPAAADTPGLGSASGQLPPLREELVLHRGPNTRHGAPSWTLEDPATNRFHRIGWLEFEILARWHLGTPAAIAERIDAETALRPETSDVEAFVGFLERANLLQMRGREAIARLLGQAAAKRSHWAMWLVKNYLFVRIPLLRPDRLLDAAGPFARLFQTRTALVATLAAMVAGLFLVVRQWDAFTHTFLHFFSLEGALLAGLCLVFAKVLHELGHAFTAKRYGCRVPTMGIAFLVLWPVLYTDTSDAWKLPSRRRRLAIGAAGMAVELALAAWATLAWSFLPDGPWRSAAFLLATTTWVVTLLVNLNPCMRFDGYFLLSDLLEVPNLQERAFRLARWWLRERLFGFGEVRPERLPRSLERTLIVYAVATWTYRFFLFLGIALLIYHLVFKLLGIVLMTIELAWFIGRPIASELREWYRRRGLLRLNPRTATTFLLLAGALALAFVPWRGTVEAPALLRAERQTVLFAPAAAQIEAIMVEAGEPVAAGRPLFRLASPDIEHELGQITRDIAVRRWQVAAERFDQKLLARNPIAWQELAEALAERDARLSELRRLEVSAPFDGVVLEVSEPLGRGEWLEEGEPLALVADPRRPVIEAFVAEADLARIGPGARARFYFDDPDRAVLSGTVVEVDPTSTRTLPAAELASTHGGGIAVREDANGDAVPESAVYRVLVAPDEAPAVARVARGTLRIAGERASFAAGLWNTVVAAALRESAF